MPSRRFLALADRLPAYGGVLSAIVTGERYLVSDAEGRPGGDPGGRAPVPATREAFARDPELRGLSSFSEVPKPAVLTAEQQAYVDAHPQLKAPPGR
jgi:hypothetical protein